MARQTSQGRRVKLFVRIGLVMNAARRRLLCLAILAATVDAAAQPSPATARGEWRHFGSNHANTKYSALDAINKNNVSTLGQAWAWDVSEAEKPTGQPTRFFRTTPLMANGKIYLSTGLQLVVALDPAT